MIKKDAMDVLNSIELILSTRISRLGRNTEQSIKANKGFDQMLQSFSIIDKDQVTGILRAAAWELIRRGEFYGMFDQECFCKQTIKGD